MYELIKVSSHNYYVQSPAKIGIVKLNDTDVILIDSGSDKDAGRKVRQILDSHSWHLTAIFNTHSNADHIGGNRYLQNQTACKIYAPGIECCFTNYPLLESAFLYGGFPPKDLRHKFLMAEKSTTEYLAEEVLPDGMSILPLPGHFFDMVGYKTQDQVLYLADCLSSRETLNKYQISFVYDVASYLETLEMIKTQKANVFIPAHAEPTDDIAPLAQLNIDKVYEIADKILSICEVPVMFEQVLQQLFKDYKLAMNFEQYALIGSTVRSYLAWLKDLGRLTAAFDNGQLLWNTVSI